jgi:hypothetical protein
VGVARRHASRPEELHCPGRKSPFWAVKRPTRPSKRAIESRSTRCGKRYGRLNFPGGPGRCRFEKPHGGRARRSPRARLQCRVRPRRCFRHEDTRVCQRFRYEADERWCRERRCGRAPDAPRPIANCRPRASAGSTPSPTRESAEAPSRPPPAHRLYNALASTLLEIGAACTDRPVSVRKYRFNKKNKTPIMDEDLRRYSRGR